MGITSTKLIWGAEPGWDATRGGSTRAVPFDAALWAAVPSTLRPGATDLYRQLATSPDYLRWWADACGGDAPGIRRFTIETPAEHWERPWEATIAALDETRWRDVAIVRLVSGQPGVISPQVIGAPLRVLVVQGLEVAPNLQDLDLDAELAALTLARTRLDAAAQTLVCPIEARQTGQADLVAALAEVKPTLLWLSGHATEDPAGFLLADGNWLTPDALAAALSDAARISGVVPLYVVLWACKTGLNERFAAPGAAPPFIRALAAAGVSAVLATLGPLADDIAPDFAATVFGAVAVGRPLDYAVARGRAALMTMQVGAGERDDWACPVVWCVDAPAEEIAWSEAAEPAQRQDLARRLLPQGLKPTDLEAGGVAQAEIWSHHRHVWVVNRLAGSFQVRSEWLSRVFGQQLISHQMVIALDFRGGSARNVLRDWAVRLLRLADGFDDPGRHFRELALTMNQDPEAGWRNLCNYESVTLALIEPLEKDDWLWDSLRSGAAAAIVLADSFSPAAAADEWRVEELTIGASLADADPLQHPLAPALAVLAFPAAERDLAAIDAAQVETLSRGGFLVKTRAGCVMPLSRAVSFVDRLGPEQLVAAHRCAFAMLDGPAARAQVNEGANEALLKARLHHAKLGEDPSALSIAAQQLLKRYRCQHRAGALLDVFNQANYRDIDEGWKVSAGWAHLTVGSLDDARDWLQMAQDDELDAVDQANKRALIAEVEKSSGDAGSRARARAQLEDALDVLKDEPEDIVKATRLRIKHDLARLTHFLDGDLAAAIPQYEAIYTSWEALPYSGLDQAITLRNLAEAQMTLAERRVPDATALFESAADNLAVARDRLPPNTGHPVAAELEYVAGRLAVRCGDEELATRYFCQAKTVGLATNHLMLVAIAEARLFWRTVAHQPVADYDAGRWADRVKALLPFEGHAWTARVLIDGHLRSARRLLDNGLKRPAASALLAARTLLDANPAFDAGSDRDRIMATYAGLIITGWDQVLWSALSARFDWVTQWMVDRHAVTPGEVWEATR
ncbi:CHAT domain-containing protein [Azospirillum argentinense]|uniref:CHAT domain-containing protein n=1 Tax=Azospirillum brasilense TaxID=192 RepID=A0A4D8PY42_AZOBR|nr:CHAT domain-containing protein [Azospirillum argentinense]QCO02837.1 CHAT domain-containing protein [Azospirillum argentinense]